MTPEALGKKWLRHLAVEKGLSANTLSNYRRDLARYIDWLEAQKISDLQQVDQPMVEHYVAYLRQGDPEAGRAPLAQSSAARALIVVRGLHAFALVEGLIEHNVAAKVQPAGAGQHLPETLSVQEVTRLIESIPDTEAATAVDLRDRALLELLYGTGARISELLALHVDQVANLDGLLVITGKGNKQRLVPVGRQAQAAIEAYLVRGRPSLAKGRSHALFLNSRGNALSRTSAWHVLKQAAQRAGLEKEISPHTLRHSYASHLIEGGADVRVVQELLGHASVTTTQIYTHISAENLRNVWASTHPRA
ncbi:site-specific tyrosine recombinase XerD [Corynebacterium pelargi]|uniref:Tyrosine recombinase XerD n=1 Tax=Corynebacterium pelargi TaxID=1471400 RepID=A0A410W937_9CORY|nr:site-specific tyrosine recombinase XerD [Corynebacterium pelargi]QAU52456.1 Tyrosine recombinase XerD [Corynebacterium pelargi]GGG67535.1 tyrosine recombinase XerD [Corynebacterium pelargi]